jgi:hypothetical protein
MLIPEEAIRLRAMNMASDAMQLDCSVVASIPSSSHHLSCHYELGTHNLGNPYSKVNVPLDKCIAKQIMAKIMSLNET